jgi:Zn-dependent peptidase ImmA (M78 family)/transcriptional regulator with XRE-family HTH domain
MEFDLATLIRMAPDDLMLSTVRIARGLTQAALSARSGISQATISKAESGAIKLDDKRWAALARELDAPASLLASPTGPLDTRAVVFHRKRSTLPVSAAARLRAQLDLLHLQLGALLADAAPVRITRFPLPPDGYVTPEEVAQRVRRELGVPAGPINDVVAVLEGAGVALVRRDLGSTKIDALMSWPPGSRPVVLLGAHAPGDRQRFSVAHELGHAVMHEVPGDDQETEADRFAAEFLMPRADIVGQLRDLTLAKLARLKGEWGVSMAALLRRARDLGQISESAYRRLSIDLSTAGFRTREPVEVLVETPRLVASRIRALLDSGITPHDLAALASMTVNDFANTYLHQGVA